MQKTNIAQYFGSFSLIFVTLAPELYQKRISSPQVTYTPTKIASSSIAAHLHTNSTVTHSLTPTYKHNYKTPTVERANARANNTYRAKSLNEHHESHIFAVETEGEMLSPLHVPTLHTHTHTIKSQTVYLLLNFYQLS